MIYAKIIKHFLITSPFNPTYEIVYSQALSSNQEYENKFASSLKYAHSILAGNNFIPISETFFYKS